MYEMLLVYINTTGSTAGSYTKYNNDTLHSGHRLLICYMSYPTVSMVKVEIITIVHSSY